MAHRLWDGRDVVTEKIGPIWLVSAKGEKIADIWPIPYRLLAGSKRHVGRNSVPYATDQQDDITYIEPGDYGG